MASLSLTELVQSLPTELYDEIFELTLTTEEEVTIDENYKPPVQLHIDRASRKAVSQTYYTTTIFNIYSQYIRIHGFCQDRNPALHPLVPWLDSLDSQTRKQIRKIHIHKNRPEVVGWRREMEYLYDMVFSEGLILRRFVPCGVELAEVRGALHVWAAPEEGKEEFWMLWDDLKKIVDG